MAQPRPRDALLPGVREAYDKETKEGPNMKRNTNATCGTCPYWHQNPQSTCGNCQAVSWTCIEKLDTEWCGQHPDFWQVEVEQVAPKCEPPALDDVLAAYRRAEELVQCYTGRICDACAHPHTVACGRCPVGWKLQFQPKEATQ